MSNFLSELIGKTIDKDQGSSRNSSLQIRNKILAQTKFKSTEMSPMEELGIEPQNQSDLDQIKYLLGEILQYPSEQIAKLHRQCYRLGSEDLKQDARYKNQKQKHQEQKNKQLQFCPCCGNITHSDNLKLKTNLNDIQNLGVAPYLFFQMFFNLIKMLAVLFIVYGIYSLVTNIVSAVRYEVYTNNGVPENQNAGIVMLSLGSKQLNDDQQSINFYYIQCWIGLLLVLIWGVFILILKMKQIETDQEANRNKDSAAYFSIMIRNIPKNFTLQHLQQQFNEYYNQNQSSETAENSESVKQLKIVKMNIVKPITESKSIFRDDKFQQLQDEYEQTRKIFIDWIKHRCKKKNDHFPLTRQQRQKIYERFYQIKNKQRDLQKQLNKKGLEKLEQKAKDSVEATTAFVTFQNSYSRQYLLNKQNQDKIDKIFYYLTCCNGSSRFKLKNSEQKMVKTKIQEAPEPEDIIWENVGFDKSYVRKRKFITFILTVILLGISFAVSFAFSRIKQPNPLISIFLAIFNILIIKTLKFLTRKEKDYTFSNRQASLGVKGVMALILNNILTPILINYFLNDRNLYGLNGLAYDIFFLGITNAFLPVITTLIQPPFYIHKIYAFWHNKPKNKLKLSQLELNRINERIQFYIGYQYVYMVSLYFFVCFFSSLQPIIVIFGMFGIFFMYWVQKFNLFHRYRKPAKGGRIINATMVQLISLGPFLFALGNFAWSNFFQAGKPKYAAVPNSLSLLIGLIIFLFPYRYLVRKFRKQQKKQYANYYDNKFYLESEYDRLNPLTAKDAIHQFKKYFNEHQKSLKGISDDDQKQIEKLFLHQYSHYQNYMSLLGTFTQKRIDSIQQQILKTANYDYQDYNPMMVFNALLPDLKKTQKFTTRIQNWKTKQEERQQGELHHRNNNGNHPDKKEGLSQKNPEQMHQSLDFLRNKLYQQRREQLPHEYTMEILKMGSNNRLRTDNLV